MVVDPDPPSVVDVDPDVGETELLGVADAAGGEDDLLGPEHGVVDPSEPPTRRRRG